MSNEQANCGGPVKGTGELAWEHFDYPAESNLDKFRVTVEREVIATGRLMAFSHWFDSDFQAKEFASWQEFIGHRVLTFEHYTRRDLLPVPPVPNQEPT